METKLSNLNLSVYSEVLDNGLSVYVVPDKNNNNIYATFTTKFGSRTSEFTPIDQNKMIKVPFGVAHFLEHKAFEQEDGTDPFTFFSERGADANANTSYYKTTYLFSGSNFFEDNLKYLLDYVQKPYFTEENVEKEKGIIIQEYEMYQDRPFTRCYEGVMKNAFVNDPIRYPIIGTKDSINSITKEDLYNCYNTFYHPANMFVVVTGNVDENKVFEIIKTNQKDKNFKEFKNPQVKKYKEPKTVGKEYEAISMNVTIPKVLIGYKIDLNKFKKMDMNKLLNYILTIFEIMLGNTSLANEYLKTNDIIYGNIDLDYIKTDDYLLFTVGAETKKEKVFLEYIDKVLKDINVTEEELNRKKKTLIGGLVALSSDIFSMNHKIMSNVIDYNEPVYNDYDVIESLNINELNNVINDLTLHNKTVFVVNPK